MTDDDLEKQIIDLVEDAASTDCGCPECKERRKRIALQIIDKIRSSRS